MDNLLVGGEYWVPSEQGVPVKARLVAVNQLMGVAKLESGNQELVAPLSIIFRSEAEAVDAMIEMAQLTVKYYSESLEKLNLRKAILAENGDEYKGILQSGLLLEE